MHQTYIEAQHHIGRTSRPTDGPAVAGRLPERFRDACPPARMITRGAMARPGHSS
ncbi:hypothetical protein NC796_25975 [Aliifodinibius sp. S!AR15-10]|uniref:hypothetical protein n=1 Tax=Aliifodinibius sp. S!AR15-10 TaxID=2950437 RepID=UPI00285676C4|nr:hypothetical protein [Aliifodinibius sp. S!AR15-10]MDR8394619.1 hypothetical protein [Aliifodinibius sp. S!AR15-10]